MGIDMSIVNVGVTTVETRLTISDTVGMESTGESNATVTEKSR